MVLRHPADRRTLFYMVFATTLLIVNWNLSTFSWPLFLIACFMGVTVSVMAHNHNHLPMWKNKTLNQITDYWITLFYGFPVFAWIPTHNANHHKFTNKPGDKTATWKLGERNTLGHLLVYPAFSAYWQQESVGDYLKAQRTRNPRRYWHCIGQYAALVVWYGGALLLDWQKAFLYIIIPGQVGLFTVLVFNFVQHVHADEHSEWNHSRNVVGPVLNTLLFNNGYHTIHHLKPHLHWSETPAAHKEIEHHIDPSLNEQSFFGMLFKWYVLGAFLPQYRSKDLRGARMAQESALAAK